MIIQQEQLKHLFQINFEFRDWTMKSFGLKKQKKNPETDNQLNVSK